MQFKLFAVWETRQLHVLPVSRKACVQTKVLSFSNVTGTTINGAPMLAFAAGVVLSVEELSAN